MALSFDINANTRNAESNLKKLGTSLETVADSLDDIARDGDKAGDKLESSFKDMARAAKDAGDDGSKGMDKIRTGAKEVQQEIGQNLGEAVSSVRGDLSDLGQVGQDTLGGLAATLAGAGPAGIVGAAALAAGAAGLGLVTAELEAAEERRATLAERASELASAYVEAGGKVIDAFAAAETAQEVISDPEKKKMIQDYAKTLGVDFSVALGAFIGREEDVAAVEEIVNKAIEDNNDLLGENAGALSKARAEQSKTHQANEDLINSGSELLKVTTDAGAEFDTYSEYLRHVAETTVGATTKTDEFGDSIVTLPDGKQVYIDAETGQATIDVDDIEQKIYNLPTQKDIKIRVQVQDETQRGLDQIVANVNARRASLGVNVYGIGGRTVE